MTKESDIFFMRRAITLASLAAYSARPNPHVGCVLVRDDVVIGEGYTCATGGDHAEIQALKAAGDARGATAYVTLEPCCHTGLTGPCADALISAGISRVFVALEDPNPIVSGKGLARLAAAGLQVITGILNEEAQALIAGFVARMRRGRGRVRAKLAMSLDGRTAMPSGESKWITNTTSRKDVQILRAESCAIITGIGTVIADDCALTVRLMDAEYSREEHKATSLSPPLRVLLDSDLRVSKKSRILSAEVPTLVMHAPHVDKKLSFPKNVECKAIESNELGLDLHSVMDALNDRCCNEILVESGPLLAGSLLREGLLDELIIYIAPMFLGSAAKPLLHFPLQNMIDRIPLKIIEKVDLDGDFRLTVVPNSALEAN